MRGLQRLLKRVSIRYGLFICLYTVLAVGLAVFDVLLTRETGTVGQAASMADLSAISKGMVIMAVLTLCKLVFASLGELLRGRYAGKVAHAMRAFFARHFTTIGYKALSHYQSGDVLAMYNADLPRVVGILAEIIPQLLAEGAMLLVAGGFMLSIHPLYTLIFFALYPLLMFMQVAISGPIQPLVAEASKRRGEYNAVVLDSLQNTDAIAAYSLTERMEARYDAAYQPFFTAQMKRIKVFSALIIAGITASFLPTLFITVASALSVAAGGMSFGGFLALTMMAGTASSFLTMLSQRINDLRTGMASTGRIEESTRDEAETLEGALPQGEDGGSAIVFENVTFSYGEEDTPALAGVSFSIPAGQSVGVVGASGSGKSTAAKLMQTLYAPDTGTVRILGQDAATAPKAALRGLIASVPQESFLFPQSIRANVTLADGGTDETRMMDACKAAGIHDFIKAQPEGYDTLLTEGGVNLSGGQRQRIAIARALYLDAPILLLDEATSALDAATERAVLEALQSSSGRRTTVVVAHRLAAIEDCDRILVMEKGRLIEEGTFDELMEAGGAFAALYRLQGEEAVQ